MKTIITFLSVILISSLLYSQSSIVFDSGTTIEVGTGADISAGSITVNGTSSGDGTFNNGPLPVELVSFSAIIVKGKVELKWQTATEVNNFGFEVERESPSPTPSQREGAFNLTLAENESGWSKIGFVVGNGNSNSQHNYSFVDKSNLSGKYSYRLKQIDNDGSFEYSNAIDVDFGMPKEFSLSQNYPNPFNPLTTIKFTLPEESKVILNIYSVMGEEIAELINKEMSAGFHKIEFDAGKLSSGIYFYEINAGKFRSIKKMILLK